MGAGLSESWPNNLGGSAKVGPGGRKTAINPRAADDDAQLVTVCLDVGALPDDQEISLVAFVSWGVGGASQSLEIDVVRGLQFSAPLAGLKVDIQNNSAAGTAEATVYVQCGYGTRPSMFRPTKAVDVEELNIGDTSAPITIPRGATHVQLLANPHNYPLYTLLMRKTKAGADIYTPAPVNDAHQVIIANGIRFVCVRNDSSARVQPMLVFLLAA